jgi:CDP-2,3-bis-(O-geranylgeranyl)-sn-glycerol synthase
MNIRVPLVFVLCQEPNWSNFNDGISCLLQVLECYIISIEFFIIPLLSAFWIMLPAYVPNPVAAVCGGGAPIDFGKTSSDARRILGDGKTYRGLFFGILAGIGTGLLQIWLSNTFGLPGLPRHTLLSITLLAFGALIGDMCKSYFKRRLGKERGEKWPIADQYDLVIGAFILMLLFDPSWLFAYVTIPVFIIILILTPILHRAVNIVGYFLGVKEVPW